MKITHLRINHLENPLGYDFNNPSVSYLVEDSKGNFQKSARIEAAFDPDFKEMVFDSGDDEAISNLAYPLPIETAASTRYYYRVSVTTDQGEKCTSETAWFETPRRGEWDADFITPDADKSVQAVLSRSFAVEKPVKKARMYMVGLGEYEFYLNGKKQGEECLLPGLCDYETYLPFQTFEVELAEGENDIRVLLGDGWYKGRYGLGKPTENYGDRLALIGELHIWYEDGTEEILKTDTSWKAETSPIVETSIYNGETYDSTIAPETFGVKVLDLDKKKLMARINPPLKVQETIKPVEVLHTPAGETVLDMGQNMVGWLSFRCDAPAGTKIYLQFGEILQDENFYRDNLRTAKAEFTYISDGKEREVRQYFTYYGFRYVKVTGWVGELRPEDFTGLVIYSQMEDRGFIRTSDPLVTILFENAKWGQKGNFLDIPTDCPQRDERCGWTGDAQVFSGTATFNMDTYSVYRKFGFDLWCEQQKYQGAVTDMVPTVGKAFTFSTVWGEAATVIPWNVYLHTGDPGILKDQYESMKGWVEYMHREDDKYGAKRLWQTGFHYGDWLALDGNVDGGVYGRTDPYYIASAYYYHSTDILAKAAEVLHNTEDAKIYRTLAEEIKAAFLSEYFSGTGRLTEDTMTGYVVALYMGLYPEEAEESVKAGLMNKLRKNRYHLETGFVGTPLLCRVLSDHGMNDMAYHILMEKGYPGWLFEVLMGATTIWERWNSVLPNGKISGTEMNSLNHYSYGSVVEWMYRNMLGIKPCEKGAGFKEFRIAPQPNYQIQKTEGSVLTSSGLVKSGWEIQGDQLTVKVTVPFDTKATVILPDARAELVSTNAAEELVQQGTEVKAVLTKGEYTFTYKPTVPYRKIYSLDSSVEELMENPKTKAILDEEFFARYHSLPFFGELHTFREILQGPFTWLPYETQERIDARLRAVE
ncbi:MAG: family 78 glycoside hydrolase catalytic domain [Eubacteriales bacterium]|nr:family 78 glycoside hydrolase catalytic domain [Eubacteriales bacterium]